MIKYAIAIILTFLLIYVIVHTCKGAKSRKKSYQSSTKNKIKTIDDCISHKDVRYKISTIDKQIIQAVERNKSEIRKAVISSQGYIHAEWINSYKKILEVSSTLDANLNVHAHKNLESKKFIYYTGLHFRSMCAANFAYAEYTRINQTLNEINQLLLSIKKGQIRVSKLEKDRYFLVKDEIKALRDVYLSKVRALNKNTATLRNKIGRECGQRGRIWEAQRLNHHKV